MAIPDPPKAGSPFPPLQTGGWNPKTPEINNFFIPEITLRGGYSPQGKIHLFGGELHDSDVVGPMKTNYTRPCGADGVKAGR